MMKTPIITYVPYLFVINFGNVDNADRQRAGDHSDNNPETTWTNAWSSTRDYRGSRVC